MQKGRTDSGAQDDDAAVAQIESGYDRKKPRQFPAGGFPWRAVRRSGSEVALNADVQADSILVLVFVQSGGLRSRRSLEGRAGELLVEVEPDDFRRERQVLDRGPPVDQT